MNIKVKEMVKYELEKHPETRNDDSLLIAYIYRDFFGVAKQDYFDVMVNHALLKLPSQESITRCRRKLQETMPLVYGANGEVRKIRREEEKLYREMFGDKYEKKNV